MDGIEALIKACKENIRILEEFHAVMIDKKEAFDEEDVARIDKLWHAERLSLEHHIKKKKRLTTNNGELHRVIMTREACFNAHGNELFSAYPSLLQFFVDKQRSLKALLE